MRPARVVAIFSLALGAALVSGMPAGATDGEEVVLRELPFLTVSGLPAGPTDGEDLVLREDLVVGDVPFLSGELGQIQDGPRILGGGSLSF